jgi:cytochrome P450
MAAASTHELFSPEFLSDPYPTFARLRREAPVHWAEQFGAFVVTRYPDCVAILTDNDRFGPSPDSHPERLPAAHVHYRNLLARAFNAELLAQLEPKIQWLVDDLMNHFPSGGQVDLMLALAKPLPTLVLAEMLGIPESDRAMFCGWADVYTDSLGGKVGLDGQVKFQQTIRELVNYFAFRVEERRGKPGDDLITRLTRARLGESELSAAQILSLCEQLMVAGRDLTTGLIGNCIRALLTHPRQLQSLLDNPRLLDAAIEETLRWDSPVLGQPRTNRLDAEMRGVRLRPGDMIVVMFGAANRDPDVFPEPDDFDIERQNVAQHLAFGRGIHFCVGAPLARLQARIVVRTVFARLPGLRLVIEQAPARRVAAFMLNLRTFGSLPVTFDSR